MLHPITPLLKACWWLLFALRIQSTHLKNLHALTLGWSSSFLLCHFPVSGPFTFSDTRHFPSVSPLLLGFTLPGPALSIDLGANSLFSFSCQPKWPLRGGPQGRNPCFFPPFKISVCNYCVCPSFMRMGIVYLLNVVTLASDTYHVQDKLFFSVNVICIRRNIGKWKKLSHRQALNNPFTKIRISTHYMCVFICSYKHRKKRESV